MDLDQAALLHSESLRSEEIPQVVIHFCVSDEEKVGFACGEDPWVERMEWNGDDEDCHTTTKESGWMGGWWIELTRVTTCICPEDEGSVRSDVNPARPHTDVCIAEDELAACSHIDALEIDLRDVHQGGLSDGDLSALAAHREVLAPKDSTWFLPRAE